jgi:hypothetical protein
VPVQVAAELHGTVLVDPGGEVEDVDRQRMGKIDGLVRARGDLLLKLLRRPLGTLQEIVREIHRSFQPDAAVAQVPLGFGEQVVGRRVVEVDVVLVREHELDLAERVVRSGPLAQPGL